ncbi:prolyl oligopeptidase family serine peptidase [bacterium]|nr:prolyl oligopeptidase family serine peptidase [bacterium]
MPRDGRPTIRPIRLKSCVRLVLWLALLAAPAVRAGALECAPSSRGYVTTWLLAGPMKFSQLPDFDRDHLATVGGETAVKPRGGVVANETHGLVWQPAVFPGNVLDFKDRTLPTGNSVFYLAADLVARADTEVTLTASHTGSARAWLDGKALFRSDPNPAAMQAPVVQRRLPLAAGKPSRLLLKLGSSGSRLQFLLQLTEGRSLLRPGAVRVSLPVADGAGEADTYLFSALSLRAGKGDMVTPGRPADVTFAIEGGYPLAKGKLAASVAVKDDQGRTVDTLTVPATAVSTLALAPVRVPWTPPATGKSPMYELIAQVTYEGRALGALSRTVYSPRDMGQWAVDIYRRAGALRGKKGVDTDAVAQVMLHVEKAAAYQKGQEGMPPRPDEMLRELKAGADTLALVEKGKPLPRLGPGVHEAAYLAEQDESPQPYFLHIPRAAEKGKPLPTIVYLHGYAPWLDKTNYHSLSYGLTDQAEAKGVLILVPFARSNTDFQAIGEIDVLHVLRHARRHAKIDPDRTFLVGYSMGGMGAYTIAAHTPHLWAGAVVMCGRADYFLWKDLDPARVEPFKRHLLDTEFGWPQAGNFLHVPVLAYQGTNDMLIKPEQAYRFIPYLKKLGTDARLVRLEGESHWIADPVFSTPDVFDWMKTRVRAAVPKRVRHKTYTLRTNRAYWLTLDAFQAWGPPAEADVKIESGNRLTITTSNVARLVLEPPTTHANLSLPFKATVNGKAVTLTPAGGKLTVTLSPVKATPLRKSPALCGPIKEVFNRRFLLVVGTDKADMDHAKRVQKDWYVFAKGLRQIVRDTGIDDAEMARSNLILFGTPKTNAVLAKLAGKLPIRFTDAGYEILGKTYKANAQTGLMFIYPNPLAPERSIVVCHGLPYGDKLGVNHKYDLLPDYVVYSDQPDYDDSPGTYCAGFFDTAWQLDPKSRWTSDGRPKAAPRTRFGAPDPALP